MRRKGLCWHCRLDWVHGLGIVDPQSVSESEFAASKKITSPLVALILQHKLSFDAGVLDAQRLAKSDVVASKRQAQEGKAVSVCDTLPADLKRIVSLSGDKGASSWLSALPVEEHGFALHKGAFRDAICLRYGWLPIGLPMHCVCGQGFSINHAMNCPIGGYPTLRHNDLRDFTAETLSEVCTDVCIEPSLQPLSGETLDYATANVEDGARVDVCATGFWGNHRQKAYFDVKVFNPNASIATEVHSCPHCVVDLNKTNVENMSRGSEKLKWPHLHLWYFQLLEV